MRCRICKGKIAFIERLFRLKVCHYCELAKQEVYIEKKEEKVLRRMKYFR